MSVSIAFSEGLAVVTVDNPPVNALSQQVRAGLLSAVAACDKICTCYKYNHWLLE